MVRDFTEISKNDVLLVGGKGASLGEMTQAGIPVPSGFVVQTNAFDQFLRHTDLVQEIEAELDKVEQDKMHTVELASERIQNMILRAQMSRETKSAIETAFDALGAKYIAVRSSATAEDSLSAAWAGQLDSFLNITKENLIESVQKCWASLFTPRAIFYRFEQDLYGKDVSVAVVVQEMVHAEKSGIAFSVHPVTEDSSQLIIEAGLGLGEAIVSGQITPDAYVVTKDTNEILDINVHEQKKALYRSENGGNEWSELGPKGAEQVLTESQIFELAELIKKIEAHYRHPQDIEWAYADGQFYITQSRPITTLSKDDTTSSDEGNKIQHKEKSYYKMDGGSGFYQLYSAVIGGHVGMKKYFPVHYYDYWYYYHNDRAIGYISSENSAEIAQAFFEKVKDGWPEDWQQSWEEVGASIKEASAEIRALDLSALSADELWVRYQKMFELLKELWAHAIFIDALDAGSDYVHIEEIKSKHGVSDADAEVLLLPQYLSYVLRFDNALCDAREGKRSPESVVDEYFWIGVDYSALVEPDTVWMEEKMCDAVRTTFDSAASKQKEILEKYGLEQNPLFMFQVLAKWRDERKENFFCALYGCLRLLREGMRRQELSPELVNYITDLEAESVFFGGIDTALLKKRNEEGVLYEFKKDGTSECWYGAEAHEKAAKLEGVLNGAVETVSGTTASRGMVRGKVCVLESVHDMSVDDFEKGCILVTSMTRPEFLPYMKKAAAFVTDEGGVSSHAAIVSRELRKPCIIGTRNATRVLKTGDLVEVDADRGVVRVIEKDEGKKSFDPKKYTQLFQATGVDLLTADIHTRFYGDFDYIEFSYKNEIRIYKEHNDDARKLCNEYYGESSLVHKSLARVEEVVATMQALKNEIAHKEAVTLDHFDRFLEGASGILHEYSKFDVVITDCLFDREHSTELVEAVTKSKNVIREWNNEIFFTEGNLYEDLLGKIAAQHGVSRKMLGNNTLDAVLAFLRKGAPLPRTESDDYLMLKEGGAVSYFFGAAVRRMVMPFLSEEMPDDQILRGISVSKKGKVQGTVKTVSVDYTKFQVEQSLKQENVVLVTEMTVPEMLPIMSESDAVVTNLGGMLSHAAITARELDIPCIVGTGNATKILKTGDLVEVDADNGVVRIIKKI